MNHKKEPAKGECYSLAANWASDNDGDVVHGTVRTGRGKDIPHAWAEKDDFVVDMTTTGEPVPKDQWYRIASARAEARYSGKQGVVNMFNTGHWGPWTESELD